MKKVYAEMVLLKRGNDWHFNRISEDLLDMMGFTHDEFNSKYGEIFLSLFSKKEGESFRNNLDQMGTSFRTLPDIYQLNCANGQVLPVQIQLELLDGVQEKTLQVNILDISSFVEKYNELKLQLNSLEYACPGGLCKAVMDDRITIIWHNQTFLDLLGYTEEQFQKELHGCAQGYIYPGDEEIVMEEFARLKETFGQSTAKEVRIVRRDKEIRTLVFVFSRVNETYNGSPVFYCSGIDITESKRAQQLAWETERFQIAIRQTSSCVWEYDILKRRILESESLYDLLGINGTIDNVPESMIIDGIVCSESADHFQQLFDVISEGKDKAESIVKLRKGNGTYIWVKILMTCVFNDMGIPVKGIAMMEDATEKYLLEQRYHEEEKLLATMAFSLIFACQLNLTKDTVMKTNKEAFLYTDISLCASAMIQYNVRNYIHPDDKVRYVQTFGCDNLIENFRKGITEHSLEYRMLIGEGKYHWRQTIAHVVQEPSRGELLTYIYVKDIEEQKTAELELRKHAERDGLTGLYNRYTLETKCRKFIEEDNKELMSAFFIMDLDDLKNVTNNYGHTRSDDILRLTAEILKSKFTEDSAMLGYMGGDGFSVFLPHCKSKRLVQQKTELICKEISSTMKHNFNIAASIGIAFFPEDGMDYGSLYQCADTALFFAKRQGRNRWACYDVSKKAQNCTDMLTVSREWLLDEANDIVYIADIHTHELLYMNSNMKKLFHQSDNYKGQKCYRIIQGLDAPCEFCTNHLLSRDEFYHWTYFNPLLGQSLILKDRIVDWYGQPARIEFATNVTEIDMLRKKAEKQNKTILSSIDYASKIQRNLLTRDQIFKEVFSDFSIIWKPRDFVGGDIYWLKNFSEGSLLCVCDCTGHGIPGALLTMLVVSTLNDVINEKNYKDTAKVLYLLDERIANVLNVEKAASEESKSKLFDFNDGCDLATLFISKDGRVTISSGNMHVMICNGKEVNRVKGQKLNIGEGKLKGKEEVKTVVIPANCENKFYIASDGLYDQIGGELERPFGYKMFYKIIMENHQEPQSVVSEKIWYAFESHRGGQVRRDDVELISFKV